MATKPRNTTSRKSKAEEVDDDPVALDEPERPTPPARSRPKREAARKDDRDDDEDDDDWDEDDREIPWMRGLWMLVIGGLFYVALWILMIAALIQFLWMAFAKEKNDNVTDFGKSLSRWMAGATRFLTGVSEEKPFPWGKWGD